MTDGEKERYRIQAAIAAMQGLIANERWFMNVVNLHIAPIDAGKAEKITANAAVGAADALMAELRIGRIDG